jgi:hypothetical protein
VAAFTSIDPPPSQHASDISHRFMLSRGNPAMFTRFMLGHLQVSTNPDLADHTSLGPISMSTAFSSVEALRRAQIEQEQLRKVCQMKEDFKELDTCNLDGPALESLGIFIGPPLDVDEAGTWDFVTTYFQPCVPREIVEKCAEDLGVQVD